MKVLLDECVDRRIAREITGHEVATEPEAGWAAAKEFDAFVTVDRNLFFQQRVSGFSIAILVLRAPTNRLVDLRPPIPRLLDALPQAKRGEVTWIER